MAIRIDVISSDDDIYCFGCGKFLEAGIIDRDDKGNLYHHNGICFSSGAAKLHTMSTGNIVALKYPNKSEEY
jgi:hypothetical protein